MAKKQTAGRDRLGTLAPKFAELNDDVLFGEVWSREDQLSARDRSMVTIAVVFRRSVSAAKIPSGAWKGTWNHKGRSGGDYNAAGFLLRMAEGMERVSVDSGSIWGGIKMSILFINGSPNKNGNTAGLAEKLMDGRAYQTLNLVDYKVYGYGQDFADDQFVEIVEEMKAADTIVIGSPVYWHNMSGMVWNLIDRFYGPVPSGALKGRKFIFLFQGAAPEKWMLEKAEYTMSRFARMYGMEYVGMATDSSEAKALSGKI